MTGIRLGYETGITIGYETGITIGFVTGVTIGYETGILFIVLKVRSKQTNSQFIFKLHK